tara:strand:- start:17250 stop:17939 length:690 start_codon:yes stop_codon:yes gene_type:complete
MSGKNQKDSSIEERKQLVAQAIYFLKEQKYDEALEILKNLTKEYPNDIIIKQNLGMVLYEAGKSIDAIDIFKQAIKLDPSVFGNYFNLGLVYLRIGEFKLAKNLFIKAISLNPKADFVFTKLAKVYFDEGDYQNALKAYNSVLEINGKEAPNANLGKALCLVRLGKTKEAKKFYELVHKVKPNQIETSRALALYYLDIGLMKKGLGLLREIEGEVVFSTKKKEVKIISK